MKVRVLLASGVAALGIGVAATGPFAAAAPAGVAHTCSARYTHAALSWGHKCLAAGQFCKPSADREYHRYKFHCHRRDASGRYRLTR